MTQTPWDVLEKANWRWKTERGNVLLSDSYLCALPSTWAKQQFGLVCASQLADHINTSFNHLTYDPRRSQDSDHADVDDDLDGPSELDWKWVNVDFLDGHLSKNAKYYACC